MTRKLLMTSGLVAFVLSGGCQEPAAKAPGPAAPARVVATAPAASAAIGPSTRPAFAYVGDDHLHNAHRVTDKLISGAAPEDEQAFKRLHELGVKTIISVDGSKPDVATAGKYGMRYVHLPTTYSTVTADQGKAIGKAIDEMPGPVYLHCHHGKHRSAAAVAVACVYNGSLRPDQAESVLKTFGTGENYKGLWKAAREAKPLDPAELKALLVEFPETTKIPPIADAMVEVDHTWDHIKLIQKAGWRVPPNHPDLDPAHEALQLQEKLHELGRTPDVAKEPEDYRRILADGEQGAAELHKVLAAWQKDGRAGDVPAAVEVAYKRVGHSCSACHKAHRD